MTGHVFISHSSKDTDLITALRQALEAYGTTVWTDVRALAPGDLLGAEIREAIEDADAVLVVLSAQAFNSKWIRIEIDSALTMGRRVIQCGAVLETFTDGDAGQVAAAGGVSGWRTRGCDCTSARARLQEG